MKFKKLSEFRVKIKLIISAMNAVENSNRLKISRG